VVRIRRGNLEVELSAGVRQALEVPISGAISDTSSLLSGFGSLAADFRDDTARR
jgi:hypothetical protein